MLKIIRNIVLVLSALILCVYIFTKTKNIQITKVLNPQNTTSVQNVKNKESKDNSEAKVSTTKDIVTKMCCDELNGRLVGTKGNELGGKYIEEIFKKYKLKPVFGKSHLHKFTLSTFSNDEKNTQDKLCKKELQLNNVIGKLSGKNNKTAIILGAHFDAWGKNSDGFFRGSLDNASGVATILQTAYNLKNKELKEDVIICAFNAEQTGGMEGSKKFVEDIKPLYNNIYYINVDCVGAKSGGPLALKNISKIKKSSGLYEGFKDILRDENIEFENIVSSQKVEFAAEHGTGVSDYKYFEKSGIPNIHIAQANISELILKTTEKPEMLDYKKIDKLAYALSYFIQNNTLE